MDKIGCCSLLTIDFWMFLLFYLYHIILYHFRFHFHSTPWSSRQQIYWKSGGCGIPHCDAACVLQTHEDSYSLATEHGRLYGWYSRTSVTPSSVNFLAMDDIPDGEPVSLREVVHRAAGGSGQGMLKCSCKLMCRGRCRCVTAGSLFRYHKSRKCNNKYKKAFVYMDVGKELIFGRQLISVLI